MSLCIQRIQRREISEFSEWLHSNACFELSDNENLSIVSAYIETLTHENVVSWLPSKILRFIATNAIGLIPGINVVANMGISFVDSFLIDRIGKWKPKLFIDDTKKCWNDRLFWILKRRYWMRTVYAD